MIDRNDPLRRAMNDLTGLAPAAPDFDELPPTSATPPNRGGRIATVAVLTVLTGMAGVAIAARATDPSGERVASTTPGVGTSGSNDTAFATPTSGVDTTAAPLPDLVVIDTTVPTTMPASAPAESAPASSLGPTPFAADERLAGGWKAVSGDSRPARSDPLLVKLPDGFIILGGTTSGVSGSIPLTDGVRVSIQKTGSLPPDSSAWSAVAPAPFTPIAAAWTGTTVLALGVLGELAAYNPQTDAWTELVPSPLGERQAPATGWVGEEFVVFGGKRCSSCPALADGAAYTPATGAWRTIAGVSANGVGVTSPSVAAGSRLVATTVDPLDGRRSLASLDVASGEWSPAELLATEGAAGEPATATLLGPDLGSSDHVLLAVGTSLYFSDAVLSGGEYYPNVIDATSDLAPVAAWRVNAPDLGETFVIDVDSGGTNGHWYTLIQPDGTTTRISAPEFNGSSNSAVGHVVIDGTLYATNGNVIFGLQVLPPCGAYEVQAGDFPKKLETMFGVPYEQITDSKGRSLAEIDNGRVDFFPGSILTIPCDGA